MHCKVVLLSSYLKQRKVDIILHLNQLEKQNKYNTLNLLQSLREECLGYEKKHFHLGICFRTT